MKRGEIQVGKVYLAKVSGRLSAVRIEVDLGVRMTYPAGRRGLSKHRGWTGTNLRTQHEIFIRSAARLRQEVVVAQ